MTEAHLVILPPFFSAVHLQIYEQRQHVPSYYLAYRLTDNVNCSGTSTPISAYEL